jgi:single-strand DNA-binding protein
MKSLNKVNLIGNLGNDPDIRTMPNGNKVANISLATTYSYKDGDNWADKTEWHKVVLFNHRADVADRFLKKGSKIFVEGRLQTRSWEDKDGIKKYSTEIVGNDLLLLSKEEMKEQTEQKQEPAQQATNFDSFDDEIPF